MIHGRSYHSTGKGPVLQPCAPHEVLMRLGDKWTLLVMLLLSLAEEKRMCFSALKADIQGISQRMLALTLRNLERDGLVTRHVFPEVPPRVEYALTDMGKSMLPALEGFTG
jgi:DNA-binding HxlR family transcriptional regulator